MVAMKLDTMNEQAPNSLDALADKRARRAVGNENYCPNVMDLRKTVLEPARPFLTDVSATEIAELFVEQIETADWLELLADDVARERVDAVRTAIAARADG